MIDIIYAIKFAHVLAAAAMFGVWFCLAVFMLLAHRSANTSVVALITRFVVGIEYTIMAAAMVAQPLSGVPLAFAIGLSPLDEFWIVLGFAIYGAVVVLWLVAVVLERRMRNLTRQAVMDGAPLPDAYRRVFRIWCVVAVLILAGMIALFAVMIWQPRPD